MKKKLILPIILVASIAFAPIAKAGLMEDLADISSIVNSITKMALEGLGFEKTARGIEDLGQALEEGLKELDKPTKEIDFKVLSAVLAETNEIAGGMNEDLERMTKTLLKPLTKILPRGKKPLKVTKDGQEIYLDDLPDFITEKIFKLLGLYYKLTSKLMSGFIKIKDKLEEAKEKTPVMKPGQIIMYDEELEIEKKAVTPTKNVIEM